VIVRHQRTPETSAAPAAAERRRDARLKQRALLSSLGPVLDLSRSGMRVQTTKRLRGTLAVVLFSSNGPHLQIQARVVWSERKGFRRHVAGLEFVDPPQSAVRELMKLGTNTQDH
jgi:hypothetical protein